MKKDTKILRANIINKSFYYIYRNLEHQISLEELAKLNHVSKYHYHRIIKEETGSTIFELISQERLKKASNLLITNTNSTISEIANKCGYISHSSFIKAFKNRYDYTPSKWRKGGFKEYSKKLLKEFENSRDFENIEPEIKVCQEIHCAYIRHKGYNQSIKKTWNKLKAIAYENNIEEFEEYALFHDNPLVTQLDKCSYVACIKVNKDFEKISTFDIPKSLYAVFSLEGEYGDTLNFLRYVYHYWLPTSGYEAKTIPAYVKYYQNIFTSSSKTFKLDFFVPITVAY